MVSLGCRLDQFIDLINVILRLCNIFRTIASDMEKVVPGRAQFRKTLTALARLALSGSTILAQTTKNGKYVYAPWSVHILSMFCLLTLTRLIPWEENQNKVPVGNQHGQNKT